MRLNLTLLVIGTSALAFGAGERAVRDEAQVLERIVREHRIFGDDPEPRKVTETVNLLENGDLKRHWYTWLQGVLTRDADPKGVFTAEGSVLKVSGEDMGCVTTREAYRDYVLDLDFRYVDNLKQLNKTAARDGGLLYHSRGIDGAHGIGIWMACFEYNIIQGASGDMLAVGGDKRVRSRDYRYKGKVEATTKGTQNQHWDPNGVEVSIAGYGRVRRLDVDLDWKNLMSQPLSPNENPIGEWNHVRLVCRGNTAEHYFNGLKVGEYYDLDPAGGRIQLQSEGFGIEYRNIVLKPLD